MNEEVQTIIAALKCCGNDGKVGCSKCPYVPNGPKCLNLTYRAAVLLQAAYQEKEKTA